MGTAAYLRYARHKEILDIPNHRSSHQTPTPRGGGIVIVILTICAWGVATCLSMLSLKQGAALIIAGTLTAVISFLDDRGHVLRRVRFTVQIVACSIGLWFVYPINFLPDIEIHTVDLNSLFFMPLLLLALIWLTNLYNFMDGIDGIAAAQAIGVLIPTATILYIHDASAHAQLMVLFASIIFGFLIWNWSPAKLFMGDIGSTFIGLTLGILALITAQYISLWFWLIILACFISDTTWTLVTRLLTGQQWREGHRLHAYQKITTMNGNHKSTTLQYVVTTFVWLAPLAMISTIYPEYGLPLTVLAYFPLLCTCWKVNAGKIPTRST